MVLFPPGTNLSEIPLAPNPSGAPPNFIDPPTQKDTILGVGLPFAIITSIFIAIRIIGNLRIQKKLAPDDCLCIFAFILCTVFLGLATSLRDTARHEWDIPLSYLNASYAKRAFALNLLVGPLKWAAKSAILALFLRVFGSVKWLRITCYTSLGIFTLVFWAEVIIICSFCVPRDGGAWGLASEEYCTKSAFSGPLYGVITVIVDIFLLVLPLPVVFGLNATKKRKIAVGLVFLVGVFALIAGIVTLYYKVEVFVSADKFWNSAPIWAAFAAENYVTIIVSCAPASSAFWNRILTQSAFYSKLRSGTLFKRKSESTTSVFEYRSDHRAYFPAGKKSESEHKVAMTNSVDSKESQESYELRRSP